MPSRLIISLDSDSEEDNTDSEEDDTASDCDSREVHTGTIPRKRSRESDWDIGMDEDCYEDYSDWDDNSRASLPHGFPVDRKRQKTAQSDSDNDSLASFQRHPVQDAEPHESVTPTLPAPSHCKYHCPSAQPPKPDDGSHVHAVISSSQYRRGANKRFQLEKTFRNFRDAEQYAYSWVWHKYSKFEDTAEPTDLEQQGPVEERGWYTCALWKQHMGMEFGAWVQSRQFE